MSTALKATGMGPESAVQGPGGALPSLVFDDVPLVVAPDVKISDEEGGDVDLWDGAGSVHSGGALAVPEAFRFKGQLGAPLASRWSESVVERLANTMGTKGIRLRLLVLDHNLLGGRNIELLCRGIARLEPPTAQQPHSCIPSFTHLSIQHPFTPAVFHAFFIHSFRPLFAHSLIYTNLHSTNQPSGH
jgi:hypothetical protein